MIAQRETRDATIGRAIAAELRAVIREAHDRFSALPNALTARRPRVDGWSPREIIGNLMDSASNNHGRFVRAALAESLVFPACEQDARVAIQRYQDEEWPTLLGRWAAFNEQVAVIIDHLPDDALVPGAARP